MPPEIRNCVILLFRLPRGVARKSYKKIYGLNPLAIYFFIGLSKCFIDKKRKKA